jgi:hypothetical protein
MFGGSAITTFSATCIADQRIVSRESTHDPRPGPGAFRVDTLSIPQSVNLDALPDDLRKDRDNIACLLHATTIGPVFDARDHGQRDGWTTVKKIDMDELFGRGSNATHGVKWLINERIWETDGKWRKGEKAKGYRLADEHARGRTVRTPILTRQSRNQKG